MRHQSMEEKIHKVMREYARRTLHSGSGGVVRKKSQALAIAYSEARKRRR